MAKDWAAIPIAQNYGDLYRNYGNPTSVNFELVYITDYQLLLGNGTHVKIRTHRAMVNRLDAVVKRAGKYILQTAGSYVVRQVRGGTHLSLHSWGLAIDVNSDAFPLGSNLRQAHDLTVAFEKEGFWYGGDFHHRKDPMHYQLAGDF